MNGTDGIAGNAQGAGAAARSWPTALTRAELARRLARRSVSPGGGAGAPGRRGDHDLNPGMRPAPVRTAAAVLVPLVEREGGMTVLLTRRAEDLADHAGEISFPGGRIEAADPGAEAAALRETEEELRLAREQVEILGRLDPYDTRTGFRVQPVVGVLRPPLEIVPDPAEVAAVFEVPLVHILDPANHRRHRARAGRRLRVFHAIPYGEHFIWGATAGMLINLYEVLRAP